jgi:hypothetical protein
MNRVGTSRNTDAILTDLTDLVTLRDLLTYDFYLQFWSTFKVDPRDWRCWIRPGLNMVCIALKTTDLEGNELQQGSCKILQTVRYFL